MSKVSYYYQGIPGFLLGSIFTGQRWVATHWGWEKIRALVKANANSRCEECHEFAAWGDTHHVHGRGGGRRTDVLYLPNGKKNLEYLCRECHGEAKIEPMPLDAFLKSAQQPLGATSPPNGV